LAKQFPLSGGSIRSIVLNACFQSSSNSQQKEKLTMKEVIKAVKREYENMNRRIGLEKLGIYSQTIKDLDHTKA
jgi:hypothetical protein